MYVKSSPKEPNRELQKRAFYFIFFLVFICTCLVLFHLLVVYCYFIIIYYFILHFLFHWIERKEREWEWGSTVWVPYLFIKVDLFVICNIDCNTKKNYLTTRKSVSGITSLKLCASFALFSKGETSFNRIKWQKGRGDMITNNGS